MLEGMISNYPLKKVVTTALLGSLVQLGTSPSILAADDAPGLVQLKYIGRGVGCVGPMTTPVVRLDVCPAQDSRLRIWCPNGMIFERVGARPNDAILRSICQINQAQ
jgi:hypothetical protein